MAQTQAQYINMNLAKLANYINHLVAFNEKYNEGIEGLYSKSNTEYITKSKEVIEYEKDIKKSYDKAIELYKDLKRIAQNYEWGMNIDYDLQMFHSRFNSARLPIYEKVTLKLETPKPDEIFTGGAADIHEIPDATEETLQDEPQKVLYGGIRYCHYTNDTEDLQGNDDTCNSLNNDNTDFYAEDKEEENQGYTGDSMELAVEYKRKHDEEQKKKAKELAKQNTADKTNQNWILPVAKGHKITSGHGYRIHPVYHTKKFHDGIDINAVANTPVYAVADGKVSVSGWLKGYGNYIELDFGNDLHCFYGHLNKVYVKNGQIVKQGQKIGLSGSTGIGTGAHLHFGVHKNNYSDNPINYLPKF